MLNYDRQQAGDAMRTDGYGEGDGMPCEADPFMCLVHREPDFVAKIYCCRASLRRGGCGSAIFKRFQ